MKIEHVDSSNISEVISACKHAPLVGLDTETTALHPKDGKLRLIQLAVGETVYILDAFQTDPRILQPLFDGESRFVGHNLGFDLRFLMSVGLELPHGKNIFDTMIAGLLLDAGVTPRPSHSLANMSLQYLNQEVDKAGQISDWSGVIEPWQFEYAAKDAYSLLDLQGALEYRISQCGLTRTMNLEMRALPGVAWFTYHGIPIDKSKWNDLAKYNAAQAENLEYALAEQSQTKDMFGWSHVNWRSPAQVVKEFNDRFYFQGKTRKEGKLVVPYTILDSGDETLTALAMGGDELAKLLLSYRKYGKLRDTYGIEWGNKFIHRDDRVYTDYTQCGPFSGRMAARTPNIQQIPHDKRFRECFVAPEGEEFVLCDLSQIELRIVVDRTRDPVGMRAYCQDNTDLHRATAELILGVDPKDTSPENLARVKEARQVAKSLNFGLIYGAGSETMRKYALSAFGVSLTPDEAKRLRQLWQDTYRGIVAWQRSVRDGVETMYTGSGRRRLNVDRFTEKLNTPVQGTGADGIKAAIALCWENRAALPNGVRPAALVHDEINMTCRKGDGEEVGHFIQTMMESGMGNFMKTVPVVAEYAVAQSWADK